MSSEALSWTFAFLISGSGTLGPTLKQRRCLLLFYTTVLKARLSEKWTGRYYVSPHVSVIHSPRGSPSVNKSCIPSMPENNPYVSADAKFERSSSSQIIKEPLVHVSLHIEQKV